MTEEITIQLTFMDGKTERVAFTPADDAQWKRGANLEKLLAANSLSLVIDNAVVLYPINNIRSIVMTPAPAGLPQFIIRTRKQA